MPASLLKAHQLLDKVVDAAYVPSDGKKTWPTETERVSFLFEQYQKISSLLPSEKPKGRKRKPS
jgi:MmeI, C-terminal domain